MENIKIINADMKYIKSYWEAFDSIAREEEYFATTKAYPFEIIKEWIRMFVDLKMPSLWLIENEKIIGFAEADFRCKEVGYISMGIIKGYREKGYGLMLLKELMRKGKEYGYKTLEIDVRLENTRAIAVYSKLGFERVRVIDKGLKLNDKYYDVLQMKYEYE